MAQGLDVTKDPDLRWHVPQVSTYCVRLYAKSNLPGMLAEEAETKASGMPVPYNRRLPSPTSPDMPGAWESTLMAVRKVAVTGRAA
ncbi:hypothetical protein GCM10010411_79050 [Actinomadura fulvescens]|uniref:Uncharacterized protein n=1 Tax=Actinomadura fulvescens TaxID=46160 RepID=A0ABN3QLF9_9ACTN